MVDRIGVKKAANRFGVRPNTVRGWVRKGIPERRVREVTKARDRHENAVRGAEMRTTYKKMGWRKLKTYAAVDEAAGVEEGHTKERWYQRKEWWEENRPGEVLPKRVTFAIDEEGRLLYVNGDQVIWRGYTVTGKDGSEKLFWTMETYLDGYDTAEDFAAAYESLSEVLVRIHF